MKKQRYKNPPILAGYRHVAGEEQDGFVIEKVTDGSRFVWISVWRLNADGTLDGKHFTEQFGRRKFGKDRFCNTEYNEPVEGDLLEQKESIEKYGGFYISLYRISKGVNDKPQSVACATPWVNITFEEAEQVAQTFESGEKVKSHLTYGAEYDSYISFISKVGLETEEVNLAEWTQEKNGSFYRVVRGTANPNFKGENIQKRDYFFTTSSFHETGFRVVLLIK